MRHKTTIGAWKLTLASSFPSARTMKRPAEAFLLLLATREETWRPEKAVLALCIEKKARKASQKEGI